MYFKLMVGASLLCLGAAGCASTEDVRAMQRPELPPTHVALADSNSLLHENIAIYEIAGAPEFRLFDGGAVITTRPTRADVATMLQSWLSNADMLSENIGEADYLLTVRFTDLRGPDVIPFTDKRARASVEYVLERRQCVQSREPRESCTLFAGSYQAQLQARMPGVTQEMVRGAIASGLIGVAVASEVSNSEDAGGAAAAVGGALGLGSAGFASVHDTLLWDWPEASAHAAPRLADGLGLGIVLGAAAAGYGDGVVSEPAARWRGGVAGAAIGFLAAAPAGRRVERWDDIATPGAFNGTHRRHQAVAGMMRQHFNRFLFDLDEADLITIRDAVACSELNPNGYRPALITSTASAVAYDCPIGETRRVS
ncbi:MAG: hypothetical protein K2P58_00195 [Hyphomonadaceae bacterium]|nr:hypothetical protein [Hyphomonadaceae bacterium]